MTIINKFPPMSLIKDKENYAKEVINCEVIEGVLHPCYFIDCLRKVIQLNCINETNQQNICIIPFYSNYYKLEATSWINYQDKIIFTKDNKLFELNKNTSINQIDIKRPSKPRVILYSQDGSNENKIYHSLGFIFTFIYIDYVESPPSEPILFNYVQTGDLFKIECTDILSQNIIAVNIYRSFTDTKGNIEYIYIGELNRDNIVYEYFYKEGIGSRICPTINEGCMPEYIKYISRIDTARLAFINEHDVFISIELSLNVDYKHNLHFEEFIVNVGCFELDGIDYVLYLVLKNNNIVILYFTGKDIHVYTINNDKYINHMFNNNSNLFNKMPIFYALGGIYQLVTDYTRTGGVIFDLKCISDNFINDLNFIDKKYSLLGYDKNLVLLINNILYKFTFQNGKMISVCKLKFDGILDISIFDDFKQIVYISTNNNIYINSNTDSLNYYSYEINDINLETIVKFDRFKLISDLPPRNVEREELRKINNIKKQAKVELYGDDKLLIKRNVTHNDFFSIKNKFKYRKFRFKFLANIVIRGVEFE